MSFIPELLLNSKRMNGLNFSERLSAECNSPTLFTSKSMFNFTTVFFQILILENEMKTRKLR